MQLHKVMLFVVNTYRCRRKLKSDSQTRGVRMTVTSWRWTPFPLSMLSPPVPFSLPSLRSRPPNIARCLNSTVSSPSGVQGEAPADKWFGAALVATVFVDFLKKKCNFMHEKNKHDLQNYLFITHFSLLLYVTDVLIPVSSYSICSSNRLRHIVIQSHTACVCIRVHSISIL